jgi:subtilase family serine protease
MLDRARKLHLRLEYLEDRTLLSTSPLGFATTNYIIENATGTVAPLGTLGPTGYTPSQIRHGYGFDQISLPGGKSGDGSGTTIAIVDAFDDPKIANDLHQFDLRFGLPDPVFSKVNQSGGSSLPSPNSGWASEIALDVEWSHAMAPGANILLVEATSNTFSNLLAGVSFAARQSGVVAVSMSWGGGEGSSETFFDSTFLTPAGHSGVTFVASSGDSGAPPIYPAISPNVLSTGGTTLNLNSQGSYVSESGWSGSGGGISSVEAQPAYQQGVVTHWSSTFRTNPDVAYDSDPNTGFPVYDSFNNGSFAPWSQFGGTSAAAPQWAALIAIADQGRMLAGKGMLDGATQTLPMLYQLSSDFHDIMTGTSQGFPQYSAGLGYDLVTGLGTPMANKIVADLIGTVTSAGTHLLFSQQPTNVAAGSAITPAVAVEVLDSSNNVVTTDNSDTITIMLGANPGGGILSGSTNVTVSSGVATFTNLSINKTGNGYTLNASSGSLTGATSSTFNITPGAATHLGFGQQPTNTAAGTAISPAVTVQVLDANNNIVTTDQSDSITLAIGTNPGGGVLSGTTSLIVSAGIGTFSNLSINKAGTGYTLNATSGSLAGTISGTFNITPGNASQLAFGQQPTNTPTGSAITPAVTVRVLDANGNLVTGDNSDSITIGLGANPGGGSLSGTLTVTAQGGVATFSNLAVSKPGNGYTLVASSGSLAGSTSSSFNVNAAGTHLFFSQRPTDVVAGSAITPAVAVEVLDAGNNVVTTDNSDTITLTLGANPGGGSLSGTVTVTVSSGIATFSNLSINKTGIGYTLNASSGSLTGATSSSFNVTPGAATHLSFGQQPTSAVAGTAISPAVTVQVLDANNNIVTTDQTDSITVAIGTNPGGGVLSSTTTITVSAGVATFSNLSINKTGTGYTLKATSGSLAGATSGTFNITPGQADHLAFAQQPTNAAVGAPITPAVTVQVLDVNNNLVTGDNTDAVTLTLSTNPTGATLGGTNPVTVSGGVATFSNLTVNLVGTGYTLGASSGSLNMAMSASFNITGGSAIIEDFEHGLGQYFATNPFTSGTTATYAAHDGNSGLVLFPASFFFSPGWIYRSDAAAQVQQGETLSAWVQIVGSLNNRVYFGFGASASGTLSLVAAPNTGQLILQANPGYGFANLAAVSQSYQLNHWYRFEVAWGTGGAITGRLFDSNGTTLLNTVQATYNNVTSGGIAFRAAYEGYFDTVTMTHSISPNSGRPGGGAGIHTPSTAGALRTNLAGSLPTFTESTQTAPQVPVIGMDSRSLFTGHQDDGTGSRIPGHRASQTRATDAYFAAIDIAIF